MLQADSISGRTGWLAGAGRSLAMAVVAIAVLGVAHGNRLPAATWRQELAETPKDLLRATPFDRVTLIDGTTLIVEPVVPRPLPDPAEEKAKAKAAEEAARKKSNIIVSKIPDFSGKAEEDRANMLPLHTLEKEPQHFLVKPTSIRKVDYFEELLLAEAERLATRAEFDRAFEHVLAAQALSPEWPGLRDRADRVLFLEARDALSARRLDQGIRILSELLERKPGDAEILGLLGNAVAERVGKAFEAGSFALGRRELRRLEALAPGHVEIARARGRFEKRAKDLADRARGLSGPGRVEGLAEALRVWPADEAIAEEFRGAFVETPVLDVAVLDIPRGLGPWERTAAEKRLARLVYLPLLAEDSEEAVKGGRDDQLVAGIEATELGRRVRIAIRDGAKWSDGSRGLSAVDVARSLADRALPEAPGYQARWAELIDGVSPAGARDVELRLSRAPLDLEKWLLGPVGPAHSGRDGRVWTDEGTKLVGSGPYTPAGEIGPTLRLDRVAGEGGSAWPIARIHERPYGDPDAAVGALLRGDVQLLEEVPPRRLQELTGTAGVKVGRYEAPRMHWIAVDGRNPALRNRSLRRGISFAIDRASLLHDFALGRSPEGADSPSDGPFPAGSYANAPEVLPLEFDPLLSRLLVTAARTELGGDRINLKFEYPASAVARSVVPEIVEALEATGLAITPVERPADDLERELRLGRRFDLAYRMAPVEDAVTEAGPLLCPGYDAPESTDGLGAIASPRMLQLLLELERAPDWPTARALVLQLDLEARDELPVIPLWQMGHHRAWREQLSGVPEVVDRLYQGIETWSLAPWTPDPAN